MMDNEQHHWIGAKPDPSGQWGFIYCITHLPSGKKYIGKKQYRKSSGKAKRRCMSVNNPSFKDYHWVENDWRWYSGSSKYLTEFKRGTNPLDWEHEILTQCDNSMDLHYQEIEYLVWNQVLTLVDEEGEYVFFNRSIPGIKFRPPSVVSDESRLKMSKTRKGRPFSEEHRKALCTTVAEDGSCLTCGTNEWYEYERPDRSVPNRHCKRCMNDRQSKRQKEKKDEWNAYQRARRAKKKDELNAAARAKYAQKKAEKLKQQPRMKPRGKNIC